MKTFETHDEFKDRYNLLARMYDFNPRIFKRNQMLVAIFDGDDAIQIHEDNIDE